MKRKTINFSYPQYRERNEIYEAIGYKQVCYFEKEKKVSVTYEYDESDPHHKELKQYVKDLYSKGPPYYPIFLLVGIAFVFLSVFAVLLARDRKSFDLLTNSLGLLLPAGFFLVLDTIYTFYYYKRTKKIIVSRPTDKKIILEQIAAIKNK